MLLLDPRPPYLENPRTCIRQLIFETGYEDFPYGMLGTGFVALCEEKLLLVTAAHCIAKDQENQLRVPIRTGMPDVLSLAALITFSVPGQQSNLDIAVLAIETPDPLDRYDLRQMAVQIPRQFSLEKILKSAIELGEDLNRIPLRAYGFPADAPESRIDIDARRIISQPMEVVFMHAGPSLLEARHLGSIVSSALGDLNGMSGSPVFLRVSGGPKAAPQYVFAGMLVRAGKFAERNIEFIGGNLLAELLRGAAQATG